MTLRRYAAKRDANEPGLRDELADAGWFTLQISGPDLPDLIACKAGRMYLVEVKSEDGAIKRGQKAMADVLSHFAIHVIVARTSEEFLRAVGDLH
jgi:Holliday junction resolvase